MPHSRKHMALPLGYVWSEEGDPVPTPEEIALQTRRIRWGWSESERQSRIVGRSRRPRPREPKQYTLIHHHEGGRRPLEDY